MSRLFYSLSLSFTSPSDPRSHKLWVVISVAPQFWVEHSIKQRKFQLTMEFSFHPWYQFLFKSLSSKCGPPSTFQWIHYFSNRAMHHRSNYECQFRIMRRVPARVTGFSFSVLSRLSVDLKFFRLSSYPINYRFSPPSLPFSPAPKYFISLVSSPKTTNVLRYKYGRCIFSWEKF